MRTVSIQIGKPENQKISRHIYGHFAEHLGRCIYDGIWVGDDSPIPNVKGMRTDIVEALKRIAIPVLRWPGGCFADEYHWMDGIGPREKRPRMVNTHWGGVVEDNSFGTHEFLELCAQLDCEPYICGNLGSGTVLEMQQWVEYITFDGESPMSDLRRKNGREAPWALKYFGVGNENWGCGGWMRPEFYADQYRRYACYVRNFGENKVYKIGCGASSNDYHWTEVMMRETNPRMMQGLSLHHYSFTRPNLAADFDDTGWFDLLYKGQMMEELVTRHGAIMDKYDPEKKIGMIVDEWGSWHAVELGTNPGFLYQQNTQRDAVLAAQNLNLFNNHADRVHMANIAQTINVLQAMILTQGREMVLTPSYYVFEMFAAHQEATLLPTVIESEKYQCGTLSLPAVSVSASTKDGKILVTLANLDPHVAADCKLSIADIKQATGTLLHCEDLHGLNDFGQAEMVAPVQYGVAVNADGLSVTIPGGAVLAITCS